MKEVNFDSETDPIRTHKKAFNVQILKDCDGFERGQRIVALVVYDLNELTNTVVGNIRYTFIDKNERSFTQGEMDLYEWGTTTSLIDTVELEELCDIDNYLTEYKRRVVLKTVDELTNELNNGTK